MVKSISNNHATEENNQSASSEVTVIGRLKKNFI